MEYSEGPFSARTEQLLANLDATLTKAHDYSKEMPNTLWHYTSADGIRAVLDADQIRLSHTRFLNDPTEIIFGWDLVTSALNDAIASAANLKPFFEMTREVAGGVYKKTHYFTFCLSARPDALSQWRAYGGGGAGYALGFDASQVTKATEPDVTPVLLRMRYAEADRKALLKLGLDAARKFFQRLLREEVPTDERLGVAHRANVMLSKFMILAALSFKDSSFEDEQEWRVVVAVHPEEESSAFILNQVAFRAGANIVKPYVDLPLEQGKKKLPVTTVMFGPTLQPALTKASLEFFLLRRGYSNVAVAKSNVPLQA